MEENQILLEQVVAVTEFSGIVAAGCKGPRRGVGSPRLGRVWRAILLAVALFALASCT